MKSNCTSKGSAKIENNFRVLGDSFTQKLTAKAWSVVGLSKSLESGVYVEGVSRLKKVIIDGDVTVNSKGAISLSVTSLHVSGGNIIVDANILDKLK